MSALFWNEAWLDPGGFTPLDRGFALGDGLFETVLSEGGRLVGWARHIERLQGSAAALGLPAPPEPEALAAIAKEVLVRSGLTGARAALRLAWTAGVGPRGLLRGEPARAGLAVSAAPAPPISEPARVVTAAIRRNETAPTAHHKTLSYLDNVMARRAAAAVGADEAALWNLEGRLACASAATLILVLDGRALTPPCADGALPGTVRAALLTAGLVMEAPITPERVAQAEAAALCNALLPVRPVRSWDGRALSVDHPVLAALRQAAVERP